ncbi:hypothetical protein OAP83_02480 [Rickettsiales bacterium]|nr:hypothetical protein [Rickettsiales bacterium]
MRQLCNFLLGNSHVISPDAEEPSSDKIEPELDATDQEQDSTQLDKIMKYEKSEIDRAIKSSHNKTKNHQQNGYNL